MLDTGSGRTYLSCGVLKSLGRLESVGLDCEFSLSTLLGDRNKRFKKIVLEKDAGFDCSLSLPVLLDRTIDLSVRIKKLNFLLDKFQRIERPLAVRFDRGISFIPFKGIMGFDLILGRLQLMPCLQGCAFSAPKWFVSFGEMGQFLSPGYSQDEDHEYLAFNCLLEHTAAV